MFMYIHKNVPMSQKAEKKRRFWMMNSRDVALRRSKHSILRSHTHTQTLGYRDTLLGLWIIDDGAEAWYMPKQQDSKKKKNSMNSSQTGRVACFCVYDTLSHVKSTGCLSHYVTQWQQIRVESLSSSSPLIGLDWNRLQTTCCLIGHNWSQWKNLRFFFFL